MAKELLMSPPTYMMIWYVMSLSTIHVFKSYRDDEGVIMKSSAQ